LNTRNKETKSRHFKCEKRIEKHQTSAWRPACSLTPVASYITCHQNPCTL
jgi:hypothetical protein